jgi:excisionase family DNA binding protein
MSQHLTIIEAAKYLNRSTKTIRKYIKDGKLKAIMEPAQFGNRYVIPLEALEAFKSTPLTHTPTIENQLVEVPPALPVEALENLIMGMEGRLLEAIEERLAARDKRLEEVLGRMENRKWWQQLFPFWK